MTDSAPFRREGGLGAIIAGLCLVAGHLVNLPGDPVAGTTVGKTLVLAGHTVLVFAFVGIYARQTADGPAPVGWAGMVLGVIGTVLVTAVVALELVLTPRADTTPVFQAIDAGGLFTAAPLAFGLGAVLVGLSLLRRTELPRVSGAFLIVGTAAFGASPVAGERAGLLAVIGAIVTAVGLTWVGASLLTARETASMLR